MCGVGEQVRKKQQRLLKNMDAHKVMLDLLQIPYEKVGGQKLAGPEVPKARGGGCRDPPTRLGPAAGQGMRGSSLLSILTNAGYFSSLPFLRAMPR